MRKFAAALLLCAACATTQPQDSAARLKQIADDYWQHQIEQNVGLQIKFGIPTKHLPDVSYAQAERDAQFAQSLLRRLDTIQAADLSEDDRVTLSILRNLRSPSLRSHRDIVD